MKNQRVIMDKTGPPNVLKIIEEALPEPGPKEVRVKVLATGISFIDTLMRKGSYPNNPARPFTPGFDLVGSIDKIGSEVDGFTLEQHVAALTITGAYTQYICLSAAELIAIPQALNPTEVEPLVLNYVTAYQMIYRFAHIDTGDRVVIHGAGGGVGSALLQLAKLNDLEIYATSCAKKHAIIQEYGAEHIDYHKQQFQKRVLKMTNGQGADAIFDPIGGEHYAHSYECLSPCGRLILYGMSESYHHSFFDKLQGIPDAPKYSLTQIFKDKKSILSYSIVDLKYLHPHWYQEDLLQLCYWLGEGTIKPVIAKSFALSDIVAAHQLMEQNNHAGRIVILPQETKTE